MERCGMSWDLFGMETERETEEVGTDTREEQEGKEEARNITPPSRNRDHAIRSAAGVEDGPGDPSGIA